MEKAKRSGFNQSDKYYYLSKSGCLCARCGKQLYIDTMTVAHVIPRDKGGTNKKDNMVALCWECNNKKGNSMILPSNYYRYLLHNEALYLDGDFRVHNIKLLVERGEYLNKRLVQYSKRRLNFISDVLQYFCYKQGISTSIPEDKVSEILKKGGFYGVYSNDVFCGLIIYLPYKENNFALVYLIPYLSSINSLVCEGLVCLLKSLSDTMRIALCVLKSCQIEETLKKSSSTKIEKLFCRKVTVSCKELKQILSKYDLGVVLFEKRGSQ